MTAKPYHSIQELRDRAHRRVPKMAFDYLEGGAGSEANITRNRSAFDNITLVPEYLRDVSKINRSVEVFGKTYSAPIGVAPVGLSNLIWPNLDISLAAMAREANIPYVLSAAGTSSIETMADIAGDNLWFQLYVSKQDEISLDLIRRSREVGIRVLVVTVDIPVPSLRLRDIRNGFTLPFRMTPRTVLDIVAHPSWAIGTLRAGTPRFENMAPYMKEAASGQSLAAAMARQNTSNLDADHMKRLRDLWPGKMIIKGVMSPDTAKAAVEVGLDGIIVSNHGGRQLDSAPATIEVVQNIADAVGDQVTIMLDSGIRTGGDIVKAYCKGAKFTFSGRSFVFGVGALGTEGARVPLDILTEDVDRTLAQIGCADIRELGPHYLFEKH